jgi:hypothetical protein
MTTERAGDVIREALESYYFKPARTQDALAALTELEALAGFAALGEEAVNATMRDAIELASLRTRVAEAEAEARAERLRADGLAQDGVTITVALQRAEAALRYISRPSLGWDEGTHGEFVSYIERAPEQMVRSALRACVETARNYFATTEEDG